MTPEEVKAFVERTTKASGVPLKVVDPLVLAKVAALLKPTKQERP
jgi:hypothetical protein